MNEGKSPHDEERDRIAENWHNLDSFTCAGCKTTTRFPEVYNVKTEVQYSGRLRADVVAFDGTSRVVGVVEVVRSHPPTAQALGAHESLDFAYYWILPNRSKIRNEQSIWLCSPECWTWYIQLAGAETSSFWKAPQCDGCGNYFHDNRLSWFEFFDWNEPGDYSTYCIFCAAVIESYGHGQWRSPGELAGGDPREWTPDNDADPATLFLAYSDAAFWSMVWTQRVANLDEPDTYFGSKNEAAENATALRLPIVNAAFDAGDWGHGADLLSPVGAPGWADYPGEPERLLAFRADNCQGTAAAWKRLLSYRLEQLPQELADIIRQPEKWNSIMWQWEARRVGNT